jgi:hypothetical protein
MQISSSVAEVGATSPGRAVVLLLRDYVVALLVMLRATEVVMCYLSCAVRCVLCGVQVVCNAMR